MKTEYKIGIYLKSYAIDEPYSWQKRTLQSIERPSAYRIEYFVSLFLVVIEDEYRLVYKIQPYEFKLNDVIKRYTKGLYILEIDTVKNLVISFESLNNLILGKENEMSFGNITVSKIKVQNDYFSFSRSVFSRNIELYITSGADKIRFSNIEKNWVEYIYETAIYEAFAKDIKAKFHNYIKEYLKVRSSIDNIDLQKILNDLQIEVEEIFINKVGGDDSYYVDETRTISFPIEQLDKFLKDYIKVGRRNIYKDSGYTSAYNMAIKGLKTGILPDEDVSEIRDKLISEYSKETHTFAIIDEILTHYEKKLSIPRLHRNDSGMISYLMSPSFILSLERIIGGGSIVVNWDNIESIINLANKHIIKLMWWKD